MIDENDKQAHGDAQADPNPPEDEGGLEEGTSGSDGETAGSDDYASPFRIARELRQFLSGKFRFAPDLKPDKKGVASAAANLTPKAIEILESTERARFEDATDGAGKRVLAWVDRAHRCTRMINTDIRELKKKLRGTDQFLPSTEPPHPLGAMGITVMALLGALAGMMLAVPIIAWQGFLADFVFNEESAALAFSFLCLASVGILDALPYFMGNNEARQKYRFGLGVVGLVVLPFWALGMAMTIGGPLVGEMPSELIAPAWVGKAIAVSSLLLEPITCAACIQGCVVINESRKVRVKNEAYFDTLGEIKAKERAAFAVQRSVPDLLGVNSKYEAALKSHLGLAVAEAKLLSERFGM